MSKRENTNILRGPFSVRCDAMQIRINCQENDGNGFLVVVVVKPHSSSGLVFGRINAEFGE